MTTALATQPAPAFDVAQAERALPMGAVAVPVRPNNQLFELLDRFCKTMITAHHLSPMTALTYEWRLGSFFRWLTRNGIETIAAVTYAHFEDVMAEIKWPSPATSHKFACQCRKFIRWCKARGAMPSDERADFTGGYKAPKAPRGKPKSIPREELVKLLDGARTYGRPGGRMEVACALAGLAGLRRAECMWVKWSDLDLDRNRMRIAAPKTRRMGDRSVRHVPVSVKLREILLRNRGERKDEDTILDFPSFGGTSGNGNRSLHALCRKVKIKPIGCHSLRHTAATLMVQAGVDIVIRSKEFSRGEQVLYELSAADEPSPPRGDRARTSVSTASRPDGASMANAPSPPTIVAPSTSECRPPSATRSTRAPLRGDPLLPSRTIPRSVLSALSIPAAAVPRGEGAS